MQYFTADYVILAAAIVAAVLGLIGGFSGALAFLSASVVGALAGKVAWLQSAGRFEASWSRGLCVLVVSLLVFGLVRWGVKRIVNGLLRQPADAVFGLLVAAASGFALAVLAVHLANLSGAVAIQSEIVTRVTGFLGVA